MKIMVIDRDRDGMEQLETILAEIAGINLTIESTKNAALETLAKDPHDLVLIDPAPQNDELRAFIIGCRRNCPHYLPIFVTSHQLTQQEVQKAGGNGVLSKPFDEGLIKNTIENARNLIQFNRQLNDNQDHFPSGGGVISKAAFNQIFISCLDRADRYGDKTYLIFSKIENMSEIQSHHGEDKALIICDNLKKYTMKIRRLSDIAGRTATYEMCLMVMNPKNDDEPMMAVNRFADSMSEYAELVTIDNIPLKISVNLMAVPSGEILLSKLIEER